MLQQITIDSFNLENGTTVNEFSLFYETFGQPLNTAPIILVNHALTGNSTVTGPNGWWNDLIGENKTIDIQKYTVIAFNVPGNGYVGNLLENYSDFNARDIAKLFLKGLESLEINKLFAIIGGSVGGGIAWEMLALKPEITDNLIPIATDWKSTDWLIANCFLQEQILNNSSKPIEDARTHAMMCYRTPESFKEKFNRSVNEEKNIFNVESWLIHHGERLQKRFQLSSYKLMNQLLRSIDITRNTASFEDLISKTDAQIHIIGINSDLFFTPSENRETYEELQKMNKKVSYGEIDSIHGHDAFLIEYKQLDNLLAHIF